MKESNAEIDVDGGLISGTLVTHEEALNSAVSIIIAGSGPTDRNGNQEGLRNDSLEKISTSLLRHQYASFRFDKRGVGKSCFPSLLESDLTIDTYVKDIHSIIQTLSDEYGFRTFNLIGHSEGGLIALLVAQTACINSLVLIATPALSFAENLIKQYQLRAPQFTEDVETILEAIKQGKAIQCGCEHLSLVFRPSVIPYIKSCYFIDPLAIASTLSRPIHVIQGDNDIQVEAMNGMMFEEVLGKSFVRLTMCKGMNHVLVRSFKDHDQNIHTYNDPTQPIHPKLQNALIDAL
ncbi:alpha/beta hydrolase [Enterovibrio norvegicus]|uniref:alpha/beta hydrolase n=1 Tax=Enterovibrio norvegicus TaxID=188144 RepID=UPI0035528B2E